MKYKAVIYDIDGTLLDTIAMNMYPLMQVIEEEKQEKWTYEEVKPFFSMTGKQTMEALGLDYETVYPKWVRYVNAYEKKAAPFEGVEPLMKALHEKGIVQAVVSAKTRAQYEIDMTDLMPYIDQTVLFEDTQKHKPDPEPLFLCLEKLGLSSHEVLYIGDARVDALASQASGIAFGLATWAGLVIKDIPEPAYTFASPTDVLELFADA